MLKYDNEFYYTYIESDECKSTSDRYDLLTIPNVCPICGRTIRPIPVFSYENYMDLRVVFKCSYEGCDELFLSYYKGIMGMGGPTNQFNFVDSKPKACIPKKFEGGIDALSPSFVEIYNQAKYSEELDLDQICGVGYRKALEFLIKDYCKSENPSEVASIEKKLLGKCIAEYIEDQDIKDCSTRATWLGNDETHYVKKWIDKDIEDLKTLIDLTVFWIAKKLTTKKYMTAMATGK